MTNPTEITAEPGTPFVDIVREFDAPVVAVFRAHTDAEQFALWTGPRRLTMEVLEFDARSGGTWHYISHDPKGGDFEFRGIFHTVVPNEQIIGTFEYAGEPGQVSLGFSTFEDLGGRTRLTARSVFPSVEARDGMVAAGMSYGVNEGYEKLDELVASERTPSSSLGQ
jgi:uncharacterized protein YndB with AHSA1/START domain